MRRRSSSFAATAWSASIPGPGRKPSSFPPARPVEGGRPMRHSMAILARELDERRQLWWISLLAWLPWGLRWLGMVDFASDTQIGVAMGGATAVVAILAILLGASVIG